MFSRIHSRKTNALESVFSSHLQIFLERRTQTFLFLKKDTVLSKQRCRNHEHSHKLLVLMLSLMKPINHDISLSLSLSLSLSISLSVCLSVSLSVSLSLSLSLVASAIFFSAIDHFGRFPSFLARRTFFIKFRIKWGRSKLTDVNLCFSTFAPMEY